MKLLQMTDITKRFFGVTVLDKVSFDVEEGEVHALLGENGAGKSTLMNILGGVHQRDGGTVEFCGKQMDSITVKSAQIGGRGRDRLRPPGTERHQRPDRLRESVFEQGDPGQVPSPE